MTASVPSPALIIIGAERAATTSLLRYLGQHPALYAHRQREFGFVDSRREFTRGYGPAFRRYFAGIGPGQEPIAKSIRILYSVEACERVHGMWPQIKLVLSVREPVARAYSGYWMAYRRGVERAASFGEAIGLERVGPSLRLQSGSHSPYLDRGMYAKHLERVLQVFPRGQLQVLRFEDITRRPQQTCRDVYRFLGSIEADYRPDVGQVNNAFALPRSRILAQFLSDQRRGRVLKSMLRSILPAPLLDRIRDALRKANEKGARKPALREDVRAFLHAYYQPHNDRLAAMTGLNLEAWRWRG